MRKCVYEVEAKRSRTREVGVSKEAERIFTQIAGSVGKVPNHHVSKRRGEGAEQRSGTDQHYRELA